MYVGAYIIFMKNPKKKKFEYISATEARKDFFNIIDRVKDAPSTVTISVNGNPEVIIMNKEEYDSWNDTMEVLADEELMRQIRQGEKDIKAGRLHDWEDIKKELKLND